MRIIQIVENQAFDFTKIQGGSSNTVTVALAQGLDVGQAKTAMVIVRVHSYPTPVLDSGTSLKVSAFRSWPYPADPSCPYRVTGAGDWVKIDTAPFAGKIFSTAAIANVGPSLDITLTAEQPSTPANLTANLSVALLLWDA